jgi:flagella basal body P-ring formation protein FlgA
MPETARSRITLFFLTILTGSLSAESAEIQFKPQADVRGSLVLLGDVAQIQDPDPKQVETLRRIELFPSPARGRVRAVTDVEIRQLLQLHGVSNTEHRFAGAELVRIAHAKTGPTAVLPPVANAASGNENAVVVAKRSIETGTILRAVDVELKVVEKPAANGATLKNIETVVGQESLRSYSAGQPIDTRSLRKPILVRRGDAVVVVAKAAGVRVRTTVKALADGAVGELLPVESLVNREKFSVVVTGLRQAEVFASGSTVTEVNPAPAKLPGEQR